MHDLATIKAINANPAAYHAANAAAEAERVRTQPGRDVLAAQQKAHGDRVRARQLQNGPYVTTLAADTPAAALTPFMQFWLELNEQRGEDVGYGEARRQFTGGKTPEGAVTFVEKGDGLRAIPAPDRQNGEEAWYGEYREITGKGTKWHRVVNDSGNPILYTSPTYALGAAVWAKGNAIQKAFH